jgi:hypothetical protein
MKKKILIPLFMLAMAFSVSAFAQPGDPPPPNGGGDPTQSGNTPVGGCAPIDGGLGILLLAGAAYGGWSLRCARNDHSVKQL